MESSIKLRMNNTNNLLKYTQKKSFLSPPTISLLNDALKRNGGDDRTTHSLINSFQ